MLAQASALNVLVPCCAVPRANTAARFPVTVIEVTWPLNAPKTEKLPPGDSPDGPLCASMNSERNPYDAAP